MPQLSSGSHSNNAATAPVSLVPSFRTCGDPPPQLHNGSGWYVGLVFSQIWCAKSDPAQGPDLGMLHMTTCAGSRATCWVRPGILSPGPCTSSMSYIRPGVLSLGPLIGSKAAFWVGPRIWLQSLCMVWTQHAALEPVPGVGPGWRAAANIYCHPFKCVCSCPHCSLGCSKPVLEAHELEAG